MSVEREVLDQLLGGDLSLEIIAGLFPDLGHCRQAIGAMLDDGQVLLLDSSGNQIPKWRYRGLQSQPEFWSVGTPYRLSITDSGVKLVT